MLEWYTVTSAIATSGTETLSGSDPWAPRPAFEARSRILTKGTRRLMSKRLQHPVPWCTYQMREYTQKVDKRLANSWSVCDSNTKQQKQKAQTRDGKWQTGYDILIVNVVKRIFVLLSKHFDWHRRGLPWKSAEKARWLWGRVATCSDWKSGQYIHKHMHTYTTRSFAEDWIYSNWRR